MSLGDDGKTERGQDAEAGISIFDPVLTELMYSWFCPSGGVILDPFAGGSVRGIVASKIGRKYVGVELRAEQVAANIEQAKSICQGEQPQWHVGDSVFVDKIVGHRGFDFLFSCPPYGDLEVYSDDPADISTMTHQRFLEVYRTIVGKAVGLLKDDAFACFIVGDFRAPDGCYRNFVGETVAAFESAGARLYNEAIFVTVAGSLPIRAGRSFSASRKLGKTHQNILVFIKGDWKRAVVALGDVYIAEELLGQAT